MTFFTSPRAPVLSPCTGVCRLGRDGLCEGCRRSGEEIAGWLGYSDEQRRQLMDEILPARSEPPAP
jgi:predicted Fe-S protein YdhL (DUF1289 family)